MMSGSVVSVHDAPALFIGVKDREEEVASVLFFTSGAFYLSLGEFLDSLSTGREESLGAVLFVGGILSHYLTLEDILFEEKYQLNLL